MSTLETPGTPLYGPEEPTDWAEPEPQLGLELAVDVADETPVFETLDGQLGLDVVTPNAPKLTVIEGGRDDSMAIEPLPLQDGYYTLPLKADESGTPIGFKAYAARVPEDEKLRPIMVIPGFTAGTAGFHEISEMLADAGHDVMVIDRRPGTTRERAADIADAVESTGRQYTDMDLMDHSQGHITKQHVLDEFERRGFTTFNQANDFTIAPAGVKINETMTTLTAKTVASNLQELTQEGVRHGMLLKPAALHAVGESIYHLTEQINASKSAGQVDELATFRTPWKKFIPQATGETHIQLNPNDLTFTSNELADGMIAAYRQLGMRDILLPEGDARAGTLAGLALDPNEPDYKQNLANIKALSVSSLVTPLLADGTRQSAGHNDHVYHPELTGRAATGFFQRNNAETDANLASLPQSVAERDALHVRQRAEDEAAARTERSVGAVAVSAAINQVEKVAHAVYEATPDPAVLRRVGVMAVTATAALWGTGRHYIQRSQPALSKV